MLWGGTGVTWLLTVQFKCVCQLSGWKSSFHVFYSPLLLFPQNQWAHKVLREWKPFVGNSSGLQLGPDELLDILLWHNAGFIWIMLSFSCLSNQNALTCSGYDFLRLSALPAPELWIVLQDTNFTMRKIGWTIPCAKYSLISSKTNHSVLTLSVREPGAPCHQVMSPLSIPCDRTDFIITAQTRENETYFHVHVAGSCIWAGYVCVPTRGKATF